MLITSAFAYEVVAYHEDFESGMGDWTHFDGAESPNNWHIYAMGDTQGNVWWMGDPSLASGANIGGYYDHQYLVLDTPARTLSAANATLSFKMRLGLETPAVNEEWDGWDSANIRISTDGGTTWNVINGTPAYHFQNSFAFGSEHGEGLGIPAWGGVVTTWTNATFDLSAYVGQSVKIRFAFASDPAYATADQPNMFGFMVDDISFGGYTNNGTDDGQMTWTSLVPLGGDLWQIATEATAPSPTHVMKNQNASNTYNPNMLNYVVSPSITLPSSGDIWADFMIMGNFEDPDYTATAPLAVLDYWGWEISPDNGTTWYAMSNPYNDPAGSNYVYVDAPDVWSSAIESYTLDGFITNYAGQTVKFRWYFQSDSDDPIGTGYMIDDFKIYNDVFIAAPENLTAEVSGSTVTLNWDAPGSGGGGGEEGWLQYCGENDDAIGTNAAADFDVAAKWDAMGETNSIYPYVGMNITKIQFVPHEANCEYSVRVWKGSANTLMVDQVVTSPVMDQWNEVVLTTPYTIPAGQSIMAGFRCNTQAGYPAGIDAGPTVDGYGNMINLGGWDTLLNLNAELEGNWNIRVYVADAAGREYVMGELPQNPTFAEGSLSKVDVQNNVRDTRTTGYRVYRDGIMIDELASTVLTYTDNNVEGGVHTYYVTAMYDANESSGSNVATAFVVPSLHGESYYDDGTAEQGYSVGSSREMAVLHNFYNGPVTPKFAKIYVHTLSTSSIIVRLFDNDGPNGMPGTEIDQVQYPAANVILGWNYISLPREHVFEDGSFYMGIRETPNASLIGVDTSANGHSVINQGSGWTSFTQGELMIRAIVYTGTSIEGELNPALTLAASNFPNPFNPDLSIAFELAIDSRYDLAIYNQRGQLVKNLSGGLKNAGAYKLIWDGRDNRGIACSSGTYLIILDTADQRSIKRATLVK
ncbi:FlgD Ig-like domain protein [anaerobic digester metagenome]